MRGNTTQGWDRKGENRLALQKGWQKGGEDARGATAGAGTVRTLPYLPHSWPRVQRKPADRLTSGYQRTLRSFCRDRRLPRDAETTNFRRRRRRLARQMGVTCDRLGRACATLFFGPQRAQLTCPEDEDGRHARCVSRSFSPLRGWRGVGEKRACVHPRRRRGGRPRVRAPRVGASQGSGGAPWRRPLALPGVVSRNTATHAPSGSGLSWKSVAAGSTADSRYSSLQPLIQIP